MKNIFKANRKTIRFCSINATISVLLLLATQIIYLFPVGDSQSLFIAPIIKERLLGKKDNIKPKDFLFINTSFDNQLVENIDEFGFPNGNVPITDRDKLTKLFQRINDSIGYKFIICDIFLENTSPHDLKLKAALSEKSKYILPRKDSFDLTLETFKDLNFGLGTVYKTGGVFYKYELFENGNNLKSLPLKMYEQIHGVQTKRNWLWGFLDDKLVLKDYIPNWEIRNYHLFETSEYPIYNLGDLLRISEKDFIEYYKNRIIVIGDFYSDTHYTIFGNIQGPLILLNTYLSLENGFNKISIWVVLFLWTTFFIVSLLIKTPQEQIVQFLLKIPILGVMLMGVSYALAVTALSILMFFLFKVNLTFSYVGLFFFIENGYLNKQFYLKKIKDYYLNRK